MALAAYGRFSRGNQCFFCHRGFLTGFAYSVSRNCAAITWLVGGTPTRATETVALPETKQHATTCLFEMLYVLVCAGFWAGADWGCEGTVAGATGDLASMARAAPMTSMTAEMM